MIRKRLTATDDLASDAVVSGDSYDEFLELFNNLAKTVAKSKKMSDLNTIVTKIFLNFTLEDKKVASFTLNSPFKEFVKQGLVSDGRL